MNKTFGLLFYLKKSKVDAQGKCPIYLRITIDGKRSEISYKPTIEQYAGAMRPIKLLEGQKIYENLTPI